jgi:hypothetical protein
MILSGGFYQPKSQFQCPLSQDELAVMPRAQLSPAQLPLKHVKVSWLPLPQLDPDA